MNIFLMLVGVVGWYFILGMFSGLHGIAFTVAGMTFTYFGILFVIGAGAVIKLCLGK